MPKFEDEDDDDSEKQKIRIRNRKAVYKAVIKEDNGKLSMTHLTLEPRAGGRVDRRAEERRGGFLLEGGDGSLVAGELRRSRACCSAAF